MPPLTPLWRSLDDGERSLPEQAIHKLEYFSAIESIREALVGEKTVLLKSSWLIEAANRPEFVLESRKNLPPEAFWAQKEMFSVTGALKPCLLSVSHAWQTPTHPDPDGRLLRKLGEVLKPLKEVYGDSAIFLDWCSLYQEPRTEEEEEMYQESLKVVHTWFMHSRVTKLLFTNLLDDIKDAVGYYSRGWTTFEFYISFMLAQEQHVLDVAHFDKTKCLDYRSTVDRCKVPEARPPPVTPAAFQDLLKKSRFSKESDRAIVQRKYHEVWVSYTMGVRELDFQGLSWDDDQVSKLVATVRHCTRLTRLDLSGNRITNASAERLCIGIIRCRKLAELELKGTPIGEAGKKSLVEAWKKARKPEHGLHITVGLEELSDTGSASDEEAFYYEGLYKMNKRHGHGIMVGNHGFKYEGAFYKDNFHGYGEVSWPDGSRYSGQWIDGQKHGEGQFFSADGLKYVGEWQCGHRSGHGRQEYEDGGYYVGNWVKGLCSGEGKYVFADGSYYTGLWYKGRYHGPGIMHHASGVVERKDYKHGVLMTREVCEKTGLPMVAAKIGPTTVTCLGKASIRQKRDDIHQPAALPTLPDAKLIGRHADDLNLTAPRLRPLTSYTGLNTYRAATQSVSHGTMKLPLTSRW
mmetsp:Transcript_140643/g.262391  ORF Transcript_140643/g.262391 Transcript_140643/m.262391 type:complete len:633 (+) Transcript_140643:165-2063(+)